MQMRVAQEFGVGHRRSYGKNISSSVSVKIRIYALMMAVCLNNIRKASTICGDLVTDQKRDGSLRPRLQHAPCHQHQGRSRLKQK